MQNAIKVMIIADSPILPEEYAESIDQARELDLTVVNSLGHQSLKQIEKNKPDLVLLDINTKSLDFSQTFNCFKRNGMTASYVVFTVPDYEPFLLESLISGTVSTFPQFIHQSEQNLRNKFNNIGEPKKSLTHREKQVLDCLAEAMRTKQIASELGITEGTVKVHIKNLLRKLGLTSRIEAAVWKHQHK